MTRMLQLAYFYRYRTGVLCSIERCAKMAVFGRHAAGPLGDFYGVDLVDTGLLEKIKTGRLRTCSLSQPLL